MALPKTCGWPCHVFSPTVAFLRCRFKYQFDPRYFAKVVASRAEEAQDSAKHIAADLASGSLDPSHENFSQGMYDLAPKVEKEQPAKQLANAEDGPKFAPNLCWRVSRVVHDLDLSRQLIRKLDAEKGIEDNPLLPKGLAGTSTGAAAATEGTSEGPDAKGNEALKCAHGHYKM